MTTIDAGLPVSPDEIEETFIRAGGPGGQNVDKVSTAVQLRFNVRRSPSLTGEQKRRLERLAGPRLTRGGDIVITASRHRTQAANRRDARARLAGMIERALRPPAPRKPTRPGKAAAARRRADKERRSRIKRLRSGTVGPGD